MDQDDQQIGNIVKWFKERGIDLAFDRLGKTWVALMMPEGQVVGSAHAAHGDTKLQAAENARALHVGRPNPGTIEVSSTGDITVHVPTAEVRGTASGHVATSGHAIGTVTDGAAGRDHATVIRDAERKAAEFGWRVGYAKEPDGGFAWIVFDAKTGDVIQSGTADDWDDAKLASIMNLYPPSGEK
jgi:hypothetical protein